MRRNITITDILIISATNRSIATISNRLNRLAQGSPEEHLSWLEITRLLSLVVERPLRKRKVVGSITTGGFDYMGRGLNPRCGLSCYVQAVLSLEAQWCRSSFLASW